MKLTDLEPWLYRYEEKIETWDVIDGDPDTWRERGSPTVPKTGLRTYLIRVQTLEEAHGVFFLCPKCFEENKGPEGTHGLHIPFSGRGVTNEHAPVQWEVSGTSVEDLSTTPSIRIIGGCAWHGYITKGLITGC